MAVASIRQHAHWHLPATLRIGVPDGNSFRAHPTPETAYGAAIHDERLKVVLPTSLFGDLAAALSEHGSATLDEHYGHSHEPWPMPGLRCQHRVGPQLR